MARDKSEAVVLTVENWRGGGRGVVILNWSEMDDGPIDTGFAHGAPVGDGFRDEHGSLVGGLYAVDFERGVRDYKDRRPRPEVTTASYDLGRARAAEDAASAQEILDRLNAENSARMAAFREELTDEQRAAFDGEMDRWRSGAPQRQMLWDSISEAQRRLVRLLAEGERVLVRTKHQPSRYEAHGTPHAVGNAASAATVRALVARRILAWSGPEQDRELRAGFTDRGRDLAKHPDAAAAGSPSGDD